ncbi:MAG: hypothetical protein COS95_08060 [Ignavibacteriales bacterium CG07_land_8_20_14_0_80_59_12]|nr:MAG: hypothetical protein COS95_08060 [Ignavibacteriales bacterium CG07_land_8_20_14_0_80_59_12]
MMAAYNSRKLPPATQKDYQLHLRGSLTGNPNFVKQKLFQYFLQALMKRTRFFLANRIYKKRT